MQRAILISLLLLILQPPAAAAEADSKERGIALYLDQDLAIPFLNEDRDYTMGLAAEFFWQDRKRGIYPLDGAARRIGEWLGLQARGDSIVRSFMLGSVTYTPDDLANPNPIYDDRPYASLLYLNNKRVRVNRSSAVGVELQLGLLGTSLTGGIQRRLHALWRDATGEPEPVDPRGWNHQISDGGELTLRLRASNSRRLLEAPRRWDLASNWAVTLGYQTNLSLGFSARAGKLASPPWTLPYDPVNRGNFLPSLAGNEWFVWTAYRLRLVAYDALLQGQFRHSDVTFGADEINHVLQEGGLGFTMTYHAWQATFAVNGKSTELRTGLDRRNHYWGGFYLMLRY